MYSGRDSVMLLLFPEREAHYDYYKHGPLAKTTLGQLMVQKQDYAYTLQGWLKAVNPAMGGTLTNGTDTTEAYPVAIDAYAFSLQYYKNDYKAIGYTPQSTSVLGALTTNAAPLFNGNIAAMVVNIPKLGATKVYNYHYDQLNRITAMDVYNGLSPSAGTFTPVSINDYQERISYDPNGNILTYQRNGDAARLSMDNLSYFYKANTNQLHKVTDAATDAGANYNLYNDIKQGQADNNYQYDAIGNMVADASENITNITWNVYGKITSITKSGSVIRYVYDASGNRIIKQTTTDTTVYVRDASGNVMSVYSKPASGTLAQTEMHLYGSSRLGMATKHIAPDTTIVLTTSFGNGIKSIFARGEKLFELSNHLGNVMVTVSDKKVGVDANTDGMVDYYTADVMSAQDYYPFGMLQPGRQYGTAGRHLFNGKEQDPEVKGTGAQYDYGFRIYDPRIGKFLSVDPIGKNYPMLTPYQYASNRPIDGIDLDGLEYITFHVQVTKAANGKPTFSIFYKEDYRGMSAEAMASIHKKPDYAKEFYNLYSESFGPEGRGFKWVYFDEKGNQLGDPVWQMKQSQSLYLNGGNSGYYSGAGSITKYGPGLSDGTYSELNNDYDFGYSPMGYADAISKRHDMIQEKEIAQPQGWLEDVRTLRSDRILLSDAKRGLLFGESNSREDFIRTTNITIFFSAVIRYKEWKEQKMRKDGLDINSAQDQRKVIFSDWKPGFLSKDWYAKQLLRLSGGGAKESERHTVKPVAKKSP